MNGWIERTMVLTFAAILGVLYAGCNSRENSGVDPGVHSGVHVDFNSDIDTEKMIGMSLDELIKKYQLDEALGWHTPNLPIDSDAETTYFLEQGNLEVRFDQDGIVTKATFEKRSDEPQARLDAVHEAWDEYVRERSPRSDGKK